MADTIQERASSFEEQAHASNYLAWGVWLPKQLGPPAVDEEEEED